MPVAIQIVLGQNITLLYDSLDLKAVDSGKLKGLMGVQIKPVVMDTPVMIVALYPPSPMIIQMGGQRTRITLHQESEDIGSVPLWEIAVKCHELVPESQLVGYGFNYDVRGEFTDGNAQTATITMFVLNPQRVETALDGQLLSSVPRFKFRREKTVYDLSLDAVDDQHIKVHLNAHYQFEGITLPSADHLEASFRQEFEYLVSMLPRLLGGDR